MAKSKISQGPWTRIRPLQRDELDPYTEAGMVAGELTWGRFRNNLCKVMSYLPRLMQTEVEYCNTFIFDPPTFRGDVQEAGFNERFLREQIIIKTSLMNRSRYSITHHSFIGMKLFTDAGRREDGHVKYLHMHEHEKFPDTYSKLEMAVLNYVAKIAVDPHLVTDEEFNQLRALIKADDEANPALRKLTDDASSRHVDSRIVEITWLACHFCLLNRWFTVLQVPDEGPNDEDNFAAAYVQMVPQDIRDRNENILHGDF
jgi:alkylhydroperoxidase family enzyme